LVERKPTLPKKEPNHNVESTSPQFKKVKEKKQDSVAVTSPQLTKLQQPKPNNSKITSPYNLSSLAAKSPINSIFRNINAKVNESLENKNKKSIKVTLPTQSVALRNVKSSGYGEKKPASNPVKQQQAATSRLSKGTASKQTTRSSHDSSINKGINISMASSLSLGEGPSNDSMFIDVKKAVQKSASSQSVTRTSLSKSSSIQKTSRAITPTVKRSSSVDARISKTKR